jgi:Domain of unknown function (DUF6602)
MNKKSKGYHGWSEFSANRDDILSDYERSKKKNKSRPVQTEHGVAGEAAIRKWLENFLPAKYGVTSGYIIPDIVGFYKLYHYDVIIFDKINSPILWSDGDADTSEQGKKRAIPAKYVYSVFEIKSTFNKKNITDSVSKLSELNSFKKHLPGAFSSGVIFFEIPDKEVNNASILKEFLSKNTPHNFWGGMILKTGCNPDISGVITIVSQQISPDYDLYPLVKNIDEIKYTLSEDKNKVCFNEQGAGLKVFNYFGTMTYTPIVQISSSLNDIIIQAPDDPNINILDLNISKTYSMITSKNSKMVMLEWGRSNFADFAAILLNLLEGKKANTLDNQIVYGKVFDCFE